MQKVQLIDKMGSDLTVVNAARVSFGSKSEKLTDKDVKLINYLAKHSHMTPFEHCTVTLLIECPLPISKQIMRHRTFSYNEISRRYTDKDLEVYTPEVWRKQSKDNKQCSDGEVSELTHYLANTELEFSIRNALKSYDALIELGVSREQARFVLPQGLMTSFFMTGNLRNWAHFISLRDAKDAQGEAQEIARQVKEILVSLYPVSMEALQNVKEGTGQRGREETKGNNINTEIAEQEPTKGE